MDDIAYWRERADEAKRGQLVFLRTTAEKWRNGMFAVASALGIFLLFESPDQIAKVGDQYDWVALALQMSSVVLALLSASVATLAAFGVPSKTQYWLTAPALREYEASASLAVAKKIDRL